MNSIPPFRTQPQSDSPRRKPYTDSGFEKILHDWMLLASTFTGAGTALFLYEGSEICYRDSSGLDARQLAVLELAITSGCIYGSNDLLLQKQDFQVIEVLPLVDICHRAVGTLCVTSPSLFVLSENHLEGLRKIAVQIQTLLIANRENIELRATPRAPSAASFVPGLVHELRNFVFGISANLDAFDARFADQGDIRKYGTILRKSLDQLNAFIEELKEFGDPQRYSWSEHELEPILREAVEHGKALATRNNIDLQLHLDGPLPTISMDVPSLLSAFIHLISLFLKQEEASGRVILQVAWRRDSELSMVLGHLDGAGLKFKDVDPTRLFEPFYFRVSGLGRLVLPGARRIFESHGGKLSAGPSPMGGMRISFMLPAITPNPIQTVDIP